MAAAPGRRSRSAAWNSSTRKRDTSCASLSAASARSASRALSVYPAAGMPLEVAATGAPFVIVNDGPTELDDVAAVRLGGRAGEVLPSLVANLVV